MEAVIAQIAEKDLGGSDITAMVGSSVVVKEYKLLSGATMASWFTKPAVALLFPVQSDTSGHWIGMWVDTTSKTVHHFDPYGFGPEQEDHYTSNMFVGQRLLERFYDLCQRNGYQVLVNGHQFQQLSGKVNTCGRHVIVRLRMRYLSDEDYARLILGQKNTPDFLVTLMCFLGLNDDKSDRPIVTKVLQSKVL